MTPGATNGMSALTSSAEPLQVLMEQRPRTYDNTAACFFCASLHVCHSLMCSIPIRPHQDQLRREPRTRGHARPRQRAADSCQRVSIMSKGGEPTPTPPSLLQGSLGSALLIRRVLLLPLPPRHHRRLLLHLRAEGEDPCAPKCSASVRTFGSLAL